MPDDGTLNNSETRLISSTAYMLCVSLKKKYALNSPFFLNMRPTKLIHGYSVYRLLILQCKKPRWPYSSWLQPEV